MLARALVAARWVVVLGWLALAVLAWWRLPGLTAGGQGIGDITSADNPALVAETRAAQDFGFPLVSRVMVVQHDPRGLPQEAVEHAVAAAREVRTASGGRVLAAIPVPADGRLPVVRRPNTTVVTYLYPAPDQSLGEAVRAAHDHAARLSAPTDAVVGVTGSLPARLAQTRIVEEALPLLELASLGAVVLIVGLAFRSVVAPLLTVAVGGVSFVLVTRVAGLLAERQGWSIPSDLEPLIVALVLGVVTDYVVYFLSGLRVELAEGLERLPAARRTTAVFAPIVVVAGLTVAAGVATLRLASSPPIRVFGPAMAVTVLVTLIVSVTLVPALLGILGRASLWPSSPDRVLRPGLGARARQLGVWFLGHRAGALLLAVACVAGLVWVAKPLTGLRTGLPFVASLPAGEEVRRAADAAATGFAPGITSPTLIELRAPGEALPAPGLEQLQTLLAQQPHVAGVLGPREDRVLAEVAGRAPGAFVSADGRAAQYVLVLDVDPLDAVAVGVVRDLREALPALVSRAGLPDGAAPMVGGDTAAVVALIDGARQDLARILLAALAVNLILLVIFLRALIAPLFLLACTALSAAATLGLTTLVFQGRLHNPGITFFVPLAAGVLLLALGSDYNLFAIGHVWADARGRSLREAMSAALPQSSAAITTAGVALAASLGTLALVPLRQFHELAFALAAGILIDALVVRTVLAPALLTLFGRFSAWPGRRLG